MLNYLVLWSIYHVNTVNFDLKKSGSCYGILWDRIYIMYWGGNKNGFDNIDVSSMFLAETIIVIVCKLSELDMLSL